MRKWEGILVISDWIPMNDWQRKCTHRAARGSHGWHPPDTLLESAACASIDAVAPPVGSTLATWRRWSVAWRGEELITPPSLGLTPSQFSAVISRLPSEIVTAYCNHARGAHRNVSTRAHRVVLAMGTPGLPERGANDCFCFAMWTSHTIENHYFWRLYSRVWIIL